MPATYALYVDWNNDGDYSDTGENVSAYVLSAAWTRGLATPLARMATTGRATFVLDNRTLAFSPYLQSNVLPRRRMKLTMTVSAVTVTQFDGYIESIAPTAGKGKGETVTLQCVDALAVLDLHEGAVALYQNVYPDTVIAAVVAAAYTPPSTAYDAGLNLLPVSADRWKPTATEGDLETITATRKITELAAADWGRFFISKSGVPTFRNRHYELLNTTAAFAFNASNPHAGMTYQKQAGSVYNHVEVTYTPRSVGTTLEVVGTFRQSKALRLEASEARTITVQFADPDNTARRIGVYGAVTPVATTDYSATSDEPGYGTDRTSDLAVTMSASADRAELTLTNNGVSAIYVQTLRVRGYAVRLGDRLSASAKDATSIAAYQKRDLQLQTALMALAPDAQRLAEHIVERWKDPQDEVRGVQFFGHASTAHLEFARDVELLQRVTITEGQTGLDTWDGLVFGIAHRVNGVAHEVTLQVHAPYTLPTGEWILGTSLLGEETYLGSTVKSPMRLDVSAFNDGHVMPY